jgi:hypothetical protein
MPAASIAPAHPMSVPAPRMEPVVNSQCMQALARANEVRLARAALKRSIGAGRHNVADVVVQRPWEAETMSLSELLCSQRRWGRARSRKLLLSVNLSENKRLSALTARQQGLLVRALEAKAG